MPITPTEKTFTLNGFSYRAQYWGNAEGIPVLALHGWLDNSASFSILAPKLVDVQLLALDLAGHGHTDHRPGLLDYAIWSEIPDVFAIADLMGWERFVLVGHSRGAMLAFLAAAVFPERISHVMLIDALTPFPIEPTEAPQRLLDNIQEIQFRMQRKPVYYPSRETAIQARCNSVFARIRRESVECLATRGLTESDQGFRWHADPKLWAKSLVELSQTQIEAFLLRIRADVLVLLGDLKSASVKKTPYLYFLAQMQSQLSAQVMHFDDGHYLHMEVAADEVAMAIQAFLSTEPTGLRD